MRNSEAYNINHYNLNIYTDFINFNMTDISSIDEYNCGSSPSREMSEMPIQNDDSGMQIHGPADQSQSTPASYMNKQINRCYLLQQLNYEDEINAAPISEMLLMAPLDERRQMMLTLLQNNPIMYSSYINQAISNDDSETAHISASKLMSLRREFDLKLANLSSQYTENSNDLSIAFEYCQTIDQYLQTVSVDRLSDLQLHQQIIQVLEKMISLIRQNKQILSNNFPINYQSLAYDSSNMSDELIQTSKTVSTLSYKAKENDSIRTDITDKHPDLPLYDEETHCINLIKHLLLIGELTRAYRYVQSLDVYKISSEEKLITVLQCYYLCRKYTELAALLNYVHETDFQLSSDTADIIQFWFSSDMLICDLKSGDN